MPDRALRIGLRQQPAPRGEFERQRHAEPDRLAVQELVGEPGGGLKRVPECMTQVEQHAVAGLALVAAHDLGLGLHALEHGILARRRRIAARGPALEYVPPVLLQPLEEFAVAEQAVLHHLGVAGAELALRQGIEQRGVGDHQDRLVERADQVLAVAGVDTRLAADRGIDLRQQRCRHLHEVDATAHDRRRKAREIANHAATQRNDQVAALDPRREHRVADLLKMHEVLGALARRNHDRRRAEPLERGLGGGEMMLCHRGVGDDQSLRPRTKPGDTLAEARQQAAADHDVVGALAKPDVDLDRLG